MLKSLVMWISLPLFLCTALFHFKHEVQRLEDEIQRIKYDIAATQESIDVIHAEWGHLTDPQRLTQLNARFLKLVPTEPKQMITLAQLPVKKSEVLVENASPSKAIKVAQKS